MGRAPCCEKVGLKKGRWTAEEDEILLNYIQANGEGSWRRPSNEAPPIVQDIAKMGGECKRKGGRTSRSAMKKKNYKTSTSNVQLSFQTPESGGNPGRLLVPIPIQEKRTLTSAIVGKDNVRKNKALDAYEKGEERENLVAPDPYNDSGGVMLGPSEKDSLVLCLNEERESTSAMFCPNEEEIESGVLGRYDQRLDNVVMCLDDIMDNWVLDPNGFLATSEERESGIMGISEERESGVLDSNKVTSEEMESGALSSNAESGALSSNAESGEWYLSSSMTSSFDDKWVDWGDWEGAVEGHKVWDEGEEILSWLWGSDNNCGECNQGAGERVDDCEKQEALAAWLLS
ncbi:hypothetical protein HHK36_026446 [Tetracentron sinense]|uniref:Uncharacterized protein n=1 Tax=Tetracentron sinense TaxID=13715 RepID=A0A834YIS2_TETSI|nr:hypothetical protein HHK36_026446 [Tetracentron sinense]